MNTQNTENTCQICGRAIKASKGIIAHHGYTRPRSGWQTSSCMGARHLPYEESCDVIPVALERIARFLEGTETALERFISNPPASLMVMVRRGYANKAEEDLQKPDGFNPDKIFAARPYSYESEYMHRRYEMQTQIRAAKEDLEYLKDRLQKWEKKR